MANWTVPPSIAALTTTRTGGVSTVPYDSYNLALHVGDDVTHVEMNRARLKTEYDLPGEPVWLKQSHSNRCIVVEDTDDRSADAAITRCRQTVLAIMTADCLPILLCNRQTPEIAAVHAGWRGLVGGVIEQTLLKMRDVADLMAWIGPGICGQCYEVGESVKAACLAAYPFSDKVLVRHGTKNGWLTCQNWLSTF